MDPRISVRFAPPLLLLSLALAGCGHKGQQAQQQGLQQGTAPAENAAGVTPMAQRVAVLGVLNKRNGIVKTVALHPGESARWNDLIVHLRACETTAPWEQEKLTGAFVQVDVQGTDKKWRRVFSGWVYKESPSLNVVEHPVYDVWPKSCAMNFPEGPPPPPGTSVASNSSSAKKSGAPASPSKPAASPPPSAAVNNAT